MYTMFFVNNNWYLFLRLHHLLCERLHRISQQAKIIAAEERRCKRERKESTAIALRLKAPSKLQMTGDSESRLTEDTELHTRRWQYDLTQFPR